MRIGTPKLRDTASWVLVFCALVTTTLVVRRELMYGATAATTEPQAVRVEGWNEALAAGIRTGRVDAPVQIVEFGDFQCPGCARFESTVRAIREKYADEVAFTFAHFPLPHHRYAESAARAAECAEMQGRFEAMRLLLFEKQTELGAAPWMDFAKRVGIPDVEQFEACVNDTRPVARIEQGKQLAERLSVRGTPTVIVNGWMLPGIPSSEDIERLVRSVIDGRSPADMDFLLRGGGN